MTHDGWRCVCTTHHDQDIETGGVLTEHEPDKAADAAYLSDQHVNRFGELDGPVEEITERYRGHDVDHRGWNGEQRACARDQYTRREE